jgi:hypothetical protein
MVIVALGTITAVGLYFGAYFACASVYYRFAMTVKEPSIESAYVHYKVGPLSQAFAQSFFEPARLFDVNYFRADIWKDRPHIEAEP